MAPLTTLYDVLSGSPDSIALSLASGGPKVKRGALQKCIIDTASALQRSGIRPGDVISMAYQNTVEFVVAFLAITYARGVAAPLNSAYKQEEFAFYLEDTHSKLLLLPADGNKAAEAAASKLQVPIAKLTISIQGGVPATAITPQTPGLKLAAVGCSNQQLDAPRPSDLALFFHTSGTTGRPKAVPLTHGNIVASLSNIMQTYELAPSDRSYLVMPLFHVHGLMAGLLSPLAAGGAVILPAGGKFSAGMFWKDCVEGGATYYTAVPTIHQVLLARAAQDYPASNPPPLRFIRSCSSSLAAATLVKLEEAFKVPVLEAYAMSEASHQMTSNPLPKNGPHKPGTVGKAQGSVQVTILDANNQQLPVGKIGEVCIRGPNVTSGYWNNPKANAEAYAGGWFHTGDQGWLDAEGYLTLTGRIKELINRGGEKISPLEVDGVLLHHPAVAEAVCFGAPDEKYGEVVAAAVVLKPGAAAAAGGKDMAADIKAFCSQKLAAFKVPSQIFITDALPKTATGKIQRRHMVDAFINKKAPASSSSSSSNAQQQHAAPGSSSAAAPHTTTPEASHVAGTQDGYELVARTLAALGVRYMFGVIGIPVTPLASSAQAAGIRFISFRNEQAAGYAAAAAGFLTGRPAVLLTVSGPGAVHGIAGLSHAQANCWPVIQISGSCEQAEVGKGAFQELDQVAAVQQFCKYADRANRVSDIPSVIVAAYQAALNGRPGAAYTDLPSNILMSSSQGVELVTPPAVGERHRPGASAVDVLTAAQLLRNAQRPLLVVGKGAAFAGAEEAVQQLVDRVGLPVLGTSMGRGLVPDAHPLNVNAARSLALAKADVAIIVGARLNWMLHFGEPPRWAPNVQFILIDIEPTPRDTERATITLIGDAAVVLEQLVSELRAGTASSDPASGRWQFRGWLEQLERKKAGATRSLAAKLAPTAFPLDYFTTLRVIRDALDRVSPAPIVVSEGANTMDNARLLLPVKEPRTRLDAGTWGTMGVGLGYAIAAAVTQPERLTVAVEGDSAFGFSGMEIETIVRYKLPIVVIIFNNGGIYGGDRREKALADAAHQGAAQAGFGTDPIPTSFVEGSRYDIMMTAFHGTGYSIATAGELQSALATAFQLRQPCVINVVLDPMAGVESGNVHAFNAPKSKL